MTGNAASWSRAYATRSHGWPVEPAPLSISLLRELPEGLADVGWPRILLFRQKSQGADNPLALAPRVREKLGLRRRIVDAVQVPLEHGWTG